MLDHMFLIAMKKLRSSHSVTPLIEADHVNDKSVPLPMPHRIPCIRGIGIFFVRASVDWHHAKVIAEFIQLRQLSWRLRSRDWVTPAMRDYRMEGVWGVPRSSTSKRRSVLKSFRIWRLVPMCDSSLANL